MKLLTVKEASEFLHIKVGTLYVWVHKKKIPYVKIGRKLVFSEVQLINFINTNSVCVE